MRFMIFIFVDVGPQNHVFIPLVETVVTLTEYFNI